mgnify:CR=1 FL=1
MDMSKAWFPHTTVEVEIFTLKNVCNFSNPANVEFFANGNYLRFFIPFESLKGKMRRIAKVYFCDYTTSQKTHLKSRRKNFHFYSSCTANRATLYAEWLPALRIILGAADDLFPYLQCGYIYSIDSKSLSSS